MNKFNARRMVLHSGLASGLALVGLPAKSCEFFSSTLRVTHPWTRASGEHDDTAIVSMRFDEVQQDDRLIGLETAIATGVEMVEVGSKQARPGVNIVIPKGSDIQLAEGGTFLRLTGLLMPLGVGRTYPMRLHFENGGILHVDLSVDFARFF